MSRIWYTPYNLVFEKTQSTTHDLINPIEIIEQNLDKGSFGCGIFAVY